MSDILSTFIQPSEEKTLDGACQALFNVVSQYVGTLKSGLGRKSKDNSEWKRVVTKYYGISRLSSDKWDAVCERVQEMGLLTLQKSEGGREYWKPSELELEVQEAPESTDKTSCVEPTELELEEESEGVDWSHNPDSEPKKDPSESWEGFTEDELEVIDILNMAFLRGHTVYDHTAKPTFYDAHRWALVHDQPLAVGARLRVRDDGQIFGYCHNSDGRYTGGLFNCAVMSSSYGAGIMVSEEKARVKKACVQPCASCPNKKWAKRMGS